MRAWSWLAAVVLMCAACGGGDSDTDPTGGAPAGDRHTVTVCMYTHGNSGSFWSTVKEGAEQAAHDLGVQLDYQEADDDLEAQAHLVEGGVGEGCDGMAVSAPEPAGLQAAADQVHAAGIPLVTMNAGEAASPALHAFTYVGQDPSVTGREAGAELSGLGATRVLCVEQAGEDPELDPVCRDLRRSFGKVRTLRLTRGVADLPQSQTEVEDALRADPAIDAVLSLDPDLASGAVLPAVTAVRPGITLGTAGISPAAVQAVEDGTIAFAMDPQPYVQGYLPVVLLYLDVTNADEVGGGLPVLAGPAFVTKANAGQVLRMERAGTR